MVNRLSLSFITLFLGFLFYTYRSYLGGFLFDSGGTFLHIIALSLLSSNFITQDKNIKYIALIWVMINVAFEYSQAVFSYAVFDYFDILASLLAAPIAYLLARHTKSIDVREILKKPLMALSLLFGASLIMGSYDPDECKYEFVYQDLEDFRNAVYVAEAKEIENISSTHIYGEYIFLVEYGKGIHIYDQSSINDIQNIAFIKIPGVLHIEVENGRIYADSLMDLVVLDLRDMNDILVLSRVKDIFDYNPWDIVNVKSADRYDFCDYPSDNYKTDGVAVSYKESVK